MQGKNRRGNEGDNSCLFVCFYFPGLPLNESAVRSRHKKTLMVSQIGAVSVMILLWQWSQLSPRTFPTLF